MTTELRCRYQRISVQELNTVYIGKIWIDSLLSYIYGILRANLIIFLEYIEENKSGCFLLRHSV